MPGDWPDVEILRHAIIPKLDDGERVEADDGYLGEAPRYVKCKGSDYVDPEEEPLRRRIEGRQETVNNRCIHWNCTHHPFKATGTSEEKLEKHGAMVRACLVLTQITMEMGIGELYEIDSGDYKVDRQDDVEADYYDEM
jgi:hypothetical protein